MKTIKGYPFLPFVFWLGFGMAFLLVEAIIYLSNYEKNICTTFIFPTFSIACFSISIITLLCKTTIIIDKESLLFSRCFKKESLNFKEITEIGSIQMHYNKKHKVVELPNRPILYNIVFTGGDDIGTYIKTKERITFYNYPAHFTRNQAYELFRELMKYRLEYNFIVRDTLRWHTHWKNGIWWKLLQKERPRDYSIITIKK